MEIDLGSKMPSPAMHSEAGSDEPSYPCLYIDNAEGKLADLPPSGTMTVRYSTRRHTTEKTEDGESHSACLDIEAILSVEGDEEVEPQTGSDDRGDELDKLANEEAAKKPATEE